MPGDRYVKLPEVETIQVVDNLTEEPVKYVSTLPDGSKLAEPMKPLSYLEFWQRLLNHPKMAKPFSNILSAQCLWKAITKAKRDGAKYARVNDDDWKKVKDIVEEAPDITGLGAVHNWQLMPFWDSIRNALSPEDYQKLESPLPPKE